MLQPIAKKVATRPATGGRCGLLSARLVFGASRMCSSPKPPGTTFWPYWAGQRSFYGAVPAVFDHGLRLWQCPTAVVSGCVKSSQKPRRPKHFFSKTTSTRSASDCVDRAIALSTNRSPKLQRKGTYMISIKHKSSGDAQPFVSAQESAPQGDFKRRSRPRDSSKRRGQAPALLKTLTPGPQPHRTAAFSRSSTGRAFSPGSGSNGSAFSSGPGSNGSAASSGSEPYGPAAPSGPGSHGASAAVR